MHTHVYTFPLQNVDRRDPAHVHARMCAAHAQQLSRGELASLVAAGALDPAPSNVPSSVPSNIPSNTPFDPGPVEPHRVDWLQNLRDEVESKLASRAVLYRIIEPANGFLITDMPRIIDMI